VIIRLALGHFLLVVLWNQTSNSNGFQDIQWRMTVMTFIWPQNKVKVIHLVTSRFLIHDFLQTVNSNFCSRTHRLPVITIHTSQTQHCSISATVRVQSRFAETRFAETRFTESHFAESWKSIFLVRTFCYVILSLHSCIRHSCVKRAKTKNSRTLSRIFLAFFARDRNAVK